MTANDIALAGLAVTFLVHFGGLVWMLSKMNASINQLNQITLKMGSALERLSENDASHDRRLAVIEDREGLSKPRPAPNLNPIGS